VPKSNFVLPRWSPLRHETILSDSRTPHASERSAPLRLAAQSIPSSSFFRPSLYDTFSLYQLRRALSHVSCPAAQSPARLTAAPCHDWICIGPASTATTGGHLQTALPDARRTPASVHSSPRTRIR